MHINNCIDELVSLRFELVETLSRSPAPKVRITETRTETWDVRKLRQRVDALEVVINTLRLLAQIDPARVAVMLTEAGEITCRQ